MSANCYGAVIPAAGVSSQTGKFKPMLPVGDDTIIRRVIHILKNAHVTKIVVIGGYHYSELKKHVEDLGVEVIYNKDFGKTDMLYSIALGLKRLQKSCNKIIFFPGDVSIIAAETIDKIMASDGDVVMPTHDGRSGHPIMLDKSVFPTIISYTGKNGIKKKTGVPTKLFIDIDVGLCTDSLFFDTRTAVFLEILDITGSMSSACHAMNLSYTKCWNMINTIESKMNIKILARTVGGSSGGGSSLTEDGRELLIKYIKIRKELDETSRKLFRKYF